MVENISLKYFMNLESKRYLKCDLGFVKYKED